jgi:hypothetical protein
MKHKNRKVEQYNRLLANSYRKSCFHFWMDYAIDKSLEKLNESKLIEALTKINLEVE